MHDFVVAAAVVAATALGPAALARAEEPPEAAVADSPPSPAPEPPSPAGSRVDTAQKSKAVPVGTILLVESLLAGMSVAGAYAPGPVGVSLIVFSPLACASGGPEAAAACKVGVAGIAAIGLLDAVLLARDRFSPADRFWMNLAAWNGFVGAVALADHLANRAAGPTGPRVALGVSEGGAPVLVVGGAF